MLNLLSIFFILFGLLWTLYPGKSLDMYKNGFINYNRLIKRLDMGYEYDFKVTDKNKYMKKERILGKMYVLVGLIVLFLIWVL